MSKQLSGAQKRKIIKQKQEECKSMSQQFSKWLKKNPQIEETNKSRPSSDLQDEDAVLQLQPISLSDHNDIITNVENSNVENTSTTNVEIENIVPNLQSITPIVNIIPQEILLNYNDPNSWPAITNNIIYSLVQHGPEQGDDVNVNTIVSADNTGRKFTKDWFYVKHINGETVKRKWMLYSINQNAIFCFPCILFGHKAHNISDQHKGFRDWRHLHPVIPQHENSSDHRNNYVKWKVMETNIKSDNTLDDYLINSINEEKMVWREILKIVVDAILFCAKNNIALRGSNEKIGDPNCGIF